jgi:predicted dehydrogenase
MIGFGRVAAEDHLPAYRATRGFEIVAVADASAAGRRAARALLPQAEIYTSHTKMLAAESLDLVDICTPPALHLTQALDALNKGVAVLCEKPVASNQRELAQLIAATQNQTVLFPCHNWHFAPGMRLAHRLINLDAIGRPRRLNIEIHRETPAQGSAAWKPDWRSDQRLASGGIWMDHSSHVIYLCEDLLGGPVEAVSLRAFGEGYPNEAVESTVQGILRIGSAEAFISLDWGADDRQTRYQIIGTDGEIEITERSINYRANNAQSRQLAGPPPLGRPGHRKEWYVHLLRDLKAALVDTHKREYWLAEIGRIARTIEVGYRSAALHGKTLRVPT